MICQECKERAASLHYTQIVNGQKSEVHLCEDCARQKGDFAFPFGLDNSFSINNILSGLMQMDPHSEKLQRQLAGEQCPECGLAFSQFRQSGRLGCSHCYELFASRLQPLLKRIHGTTKHTGKIPQRRGQVYQLRRQLEDLREQLNRAIASEEFEEAAHLRDQIRSLEQGIGPEGGSKDGRQ